MVADNIDNKNKFIFTDSFRTKDILWEAYTGFVDSFFNEKMMRNRFNNSDPIEEATMYKYANYFYYSIRNMISDFSDKLGEKRIEKIHKIFEDDKFDFEKYEFMYLFFDDFWKISGIKNIVKVKDDPNDAVNKNR